MGKPDDGNERRSRSRQRSVRKTQSKPSTANRYRITRNAFFNFLRDFRRENQGMKTTEITRRGAEAWRRMNERQKSPYTQLAREAPRRRGRRRRGRSKRRRGKKSRGSSEDKSDNTSDDSSKRGSTDSDSK